MAGHYVHSNDTSTSVKDLADIKFSGTTMLCGISRVKLEPLDAEVIVFPSRILGQDLVLIVT